MYSKYICGPTMFSPITGDDAQKVQVCSDFSLKFIERRILYYKQEAIDENPTGKSEVDKRTMSCVASKGYTE